MPVIPFVPMIISAGAQVASSVIASKAAGKAADQQRAAVDDARGVNTQVYQQQRADLAPYRQAGSGALSQLMHGMGIETPSSALGASSSLPTAVPREGALNPYAGPRGPQTGLIEMRAPTGEVRAVPPQDVSSYEARGARRV